MSTSCLYTESSLHKCIPVKSKATQSVKSRSAMGWQLSTLLLQRNNNKKMLLNFSRCVVNNSTRRFFSWGNMTGFRVALPQQRDNCYNSLERLISIFHYWSKTLQTVWKGTGAFISWGCIYNHFNSNHQLNQPILVITFSVFFLLFCSLFSSSTCSYFTCSFNFSFLRHTASKLIGSDDLVQFVQAPF